MEPQVVVLEQDASVCEVYGRILGEMGTNCFATALVGEAIHHLQEARLLMIDDDHLPFAGIARKTGYEGAIVLNASREIPTVREGISEVWEKPLRFSSLGPVDVLEALARKYLSQEPRILYLCGDENKSREWHLRELGYTVVTAKNQAEAMSHIPSVHAVVLAASSSSAKDCIALFDTIRVRYDTKELPIVTTIGKAALVSAENQEPIQSARTSQELEAIIRKLVPEHLKPLKYGLFS